MYNLHKLFTLFLVFLPIAITLLKVYYIITTKENTKTKATRQEVEKMTREEMIEYLLDELKEERKKMLLCKDNKYSYIFMLCNDMGIIPEDF